MTYGAILSQVQFNLAGGAAMQAADVANLRNVVRQACRQIQSVNDYWFMAGYADVPLVAGQRDYVVDSVLPRLKHESEIWTLDDDGRELFRLDRVPLSLIGMVRISSLRPMMYCVATGSLVFMPVPSIDGVVRVYGYSFLDAPPAGINEFAAYEDALSVNGYDCIVFLASSMAAGIRGDGEREQRYHLRYEAALAALDRVNRQKRGR